MADLSEKRVGACRTHLLTSKACEVSREVETRNVSARNDLNFIRFGLVSINMDDCGAFGVGSYTPNAIK